MTAVKVILAPEERGGLVQPCRIERGPILGQAIDFLVDVRLCEPAYRVSAELMLHA